MNKGGTVIPLTSWNLPAVSRGGSNKGGAKRSIYRCLRPRIDGGNIIVELDKSDEEEEEQQEEQEETTYAYTGSFYDKNYIDCPSLEIVRGITKTQKAKIIKFLKEGDKNGGENILMFYRGIGDQSESDSSSSDSYSESDSSSSKEEESNRSIPSHKSFWTKRSTQVTVTPASKSDSSSSSSTSTSGSSDSESDSDTTSSSSVPSIDPRQARRANINKRLADMALEAEDRKRKAERRRRFANALTGGSYKGGRKEEKEKVAVVESEEENEAVKEVEKGRETRVFGEEDKKLVCKEKEKGEWKLEHGAIFN